MTDTQDTPNNPFAHTHQDAQDDQPRRRTAAERLMAEFGTPHEVQAHPPVSTSEASNTILDEELPSPTVPVSASEAAAHNPFAALNPFPATPESTEPEDTAPTPEPTTILDEELPSPTVPVSASEAAAHNPFAALNPFPATPEPTKPEDTAPTPEPTTILDEELPSPTTPAPEPLPEPTVSSPFAAASPFDLLPRADLPTPSEQPSVPFSKNLNPQLPPAAEVTSPFAPLPSTSTTPAVHHTQDDELSRLRREVQQLREQQEIERKKAEARAHTAANAALAEAEKARKEATLAREEAEQAKANEAAARRLLETSKPQDVPGIGPSTAGGFDALRQENQRLTTRVQELEAKLHEINMQMVAGGTHLHSAISQEKLDKFEQLIEWAKNHPTLALGGGLLLVFLLALLTG